MRSLTFELSGRQRQDARPGLAKMYRVPPDRAWWPAVGAPLERGVRRHFSALNDRISARDRGLWPHIPAKRECNMALIIGSRDTERRFSRQDCAQCCCAFDQVCCRGPSCISRRQDRLRVLCASATPVLTGTPFGDAQEFHHQTIVARRSTPREAFGVHHLHERPKRKLRN